MAEILKRRFDLLALRVAMDLSGDKPQVGIKLQGRSDGQLGLVADWAIEAATIGLPERLERSGTTYQGCSFEFPGEILDSLKAVIADSEYNDQPLWLHLAKPLGYLNLVPWEQLLQPALNMPMLRLPDFVANPPRESMQSLEVALCGSVPIAKAAFTAVDYLAGMAQHLLNTVPRRTTVHIFCDTGLFPGVSQCVASMGLHDVHVHDPAEAESFAPAERQYALTDRSSRVRNPWLLWMREALSGRSVDMVHFLTHGYISGDSGALAFAESPLENQDRRAARFVGVSELLAFVTQVGAWCTAFSSPEHNYSEMGLRLLADTIAQMRPGPVLHPEMRLDEDGAALADAYRFLFGRDGAQLPSSPALFTYCNPSLLEPPKPAARRRRGATRDGGPPPGDMIGDMYQQAESVPSWVGSSQRYLEQRRRDVKQMKQLEETVSERSVQTRIDNARVIEDTLQQIEKKLSNVLASKGLDGE